MSSIILVGTCKNLFCRDHYHQLINNVYNDNVFRSIQGARLRQCTYGKECRGAHSEDEIHVTPANHHFNILINLRLILYQYIMILLVYLRNQNQK